MRHICWASVENEESMANMVRWTFFPLQQEIISPCMSFSSFMYFLPARLLLTRSLFFTPVHAEEIGNVIVTTILCHFWPVMTAEYDESRCICSCLSWIYNVIDFSDRLYGGLLPSPGISLWRRHGRGEGVQETSALRRAKSTVVVIDAENLEVGAVRGHNLELVGGDRGNGGHTGEAAAGRRDSRYKAMEGSGKEYRWVF